ncbi:putative K+-dependent Na+/Ca+ exchanger [delta proteobacterium NaphS2]|nr:putative K+-dependent Na+/Ca+ exchanger [delta proteobacterium NaphS2]
MTLDIFFCAIGFAMLYYGAEWLVKGSSGLAKSLGVTPVVIGLTVVAFGTSAPELVVSVVSSLQDKSMIALGNVVGSNICNIALILGISAVFQPITCDPSVVKRDIPIMIGISLYLLVLSLNSTIGRFEGGTLFGGIILYTLYNYYNARKESVSGSDKAVDMPGVGLEETSIIASRGKQLLLIIVGICGVVFGAQLVVDSAVKIMTVLGVSEKFIGLTIVAFGTSLPELATSVVAAIKKEMDISIGNLVGSNVFNILSVVGAASLIRPIPVPGGFWESGLMIDYLAMLIISALPWLMMRKTPTITRKDGLILLACYVAFLGYLIHKA